MNEPKDVVGRLTHLLKAVSGHEPEGATTSALARATGLARPTAHRLLSSMHSGGLVDRDATGRWLLGPELYLLGSAAGRRYDVTSLARPFVQRLATETGESAFFSARRGDETVCLVQEDGSFPIRSHVLHEGIRFPLGVASAGLAILAFLPEREIEDFLAGIDLTARYGATHTAAQVRGRLDDTRATGFALNPGLLVEGSWGLGAAVFDAEERPRWALTLTGVEQRFSRGRHLGLGAALLRSAHALSQVLADPTARASAAPRRPGGA